MCGIAGIAGPLVDNRARHLVESMTDTIRYRGPDGSGYWSPGDAPVAFGHRRLAIIDVTEGGHQPMIMEGGTHAITYNGELYNYLELKKELIDAGCRFVSESDTEVLLKGFALWGPHKMLRKANGMFAVAYWDSTIHQLWLARDRFGEKPLYWAQIGGSLAFASELKPLRCVPGFDSTINRTALADYMKYNACPPPTTIYEGARKLPPGTAACFRVDSAAGMVSLVEEYVYFDAVAEAIEARSTPFTGSLNEAADAVEAALTESIRIRMLSDVPLGAFLSGGIDSSLTVALMSKISAAPVKSFTIGFTDEHMNEAPYAKRIADILGTDHTEMILDPAAMLQVIPDLAEMYDEPFSDSSQVPTFLVSKVARSKVTVSLSGDAGDELFGGYNRYFLAGSVWRKLSRVPPIGRRAAAKGIRSISPAAWDKLAKPVEKVVRSRVASGGIGDRAHKLASLLASGSESDVYDRMLSVWSDPVVLGVPSPGAAYLPSGSGLSFTERMMLSDTVGYLPNDILVKVDRATMAVSLEGRVPMLDPNVYRLAWRLPLEYKANAGEGKIVLKKVLGRHLPLEAFERPKMGFGIPLDSWLRNELREWAEDLLNPSVMRDQGFFDVGVVQERWHEHQSGRRNWHYLLWSVLMFQSWLRRYGDAPAGF